MGHDPDAMDSSVARAFFPPPAAEPAHAETHDESATPAVPPASGRRSSIPGFEGLAPELVKALMEQEPWSDEPPMDSDDQRDLITLIVEVLKRHWKGRSDVYVTGDLSIFYSLEQFDAKRPLDKHGNLRLAKHRFRAPDVFVVLGADPRKRKSWVVWREGGKYPNVIIEILSSSTKKADRGIKKQLYQDTFRTPEYFLFDPKTAKLEGYELLDGVYAPLPVSEAGRFHSKQLDLELGVHAGEPRFFTPDGTMLPTAAEVIEQVRREAEQVRGEKDRLAAKLRELGLDPDKLDSRQALSATPRSSRAPAARGAPSGGASRSSRRARPPSRPSPRRRAGAVCRRGSRPRRAPARPT